MFFLQLLQVQVRKLLLIPIPMQITVQIQIHQPSLLSLYSPKCSLDTFDIVCNGLIPFNLTGGNPSGGTYAGSGVVGGNQFDPTINGAGNFQITYIYNDANNCTNTASQNLSIVNLSVNAGSDQTISCGNTAQLNASVNYTGTGNVTYSWSPAQGLSNTTIANPVASPGVNTTYIVDVSDGVCSDQIQCK